MSDPQRLSEHGASELELALLRSARQDAPPPASRRKALVALGLASAATATTAAIGSAAAPAVASATGTSTLAAWIGGGIVAGLVAVGAVSALSPAPRSPSTAPKAALVAASAATSVTPTAIEASASTPPIASAAPAPAVTEAPQESAKAIPTAPLPAKPSSLTEEIAALDAAREALAAGDAARALRAVEAYEHRFPGGTLGPEAMVVRIEALALRGDRATATRMATAFLAAHPRSPHATRLRSLLGLPPDGQ